MPRKKSNDERQLEFDFAEVCVARQEDILLKTLLECKSSNDIAVWALELNAIWRLRMLCRLAGLLVFGPFRLL